MNPWEKYAAPVEEGPWTKYGGSIAVAPAPYGLRLDGTPKGEGYFGKIPRTDDPSMFSSELSASSEMKDANGKPVLYPLLVPGLNRQQIDSLVAGDKPTDDHYRIAENFAAQRIKEGKSPFAQPGEQPIPIPPTMGERMAGGWGGRILQGVASPLLAGAQAFGGEKGRAAVAELDAMKQRGMKAEGNEGFDAYGLLGSMLPGAGIAKGVSAALPAATTLGTKLLQGGAIGAVSAAAQPVAPSQPRTLSDLVLGKEAPPDFWTEKAKQIGIGTAAGGAIPLLGQTIMAGKAALEPFYESGRNAIIGRTLSKASGGKEQDVINALLASREIVPGSLPTVGQASGNAGLASLERAASAVDPSVTVAFQGREAAQNAARVKALESVAGTDAGMEAARQARSTATDAMRKQALSDANVAGMEIPKLNATIDDRMKAIADALARRAQMNPQAAGASPDALKSAVDLHGYQPPAVPLQSAIQKAAGAHDEDLIKKSFDQISAAQAAKKALPDPLQATDITRRIQGIASQPGLRASDVAAKSLAEIKSKIAGLASKDGIVEANDLYMVRKEAGNVIKKYAEESKNFDQRMTAGLVKDVQGYIDDAIVKSGGKGWPDYLAKYVELSKPINQMEVGQAIAEKSVNKLTGQIQPNAYGNALSDRTAQSATGYKQASLADTMTPQQMQTLQSIKDDLSRAVMARNAGGTAGSDTVKKLAYSNLIDRAGIPTFLREFAPTQVAGNFLARGADSVYGSANREIGNQLAMTLLDPQKAAQVMRQVGPSRYAAMIDELMKHGAGAAGTTAGRTQGGY